MKMEWSEKFAQMPEKMWRQLEPLLPCYRASPKGGRPRASLRSVANGIYYVLRMGCQWNALPSQFGSSSTTHRYFQEWVQFGVWEKLWAVCLRRNDVLRGIAWRWQALDGAQTKAPLGGEKKG